MVEDLGDTLRIIPDPKGGKAGGCDAGEHVALVFLEGPYAGQTMPIAHGRSVVGRRDGADLTLASRSVSKEHCALTHEAGVVEIEDLGSTNGVAVNGTPVPPATKRRLFHGDSIRLGENLALLHQTGCFRASGGGSRIQIDRAKVASEVDHWLTEFGKWTARG